MFRIKIKFLQLSHPEENIDFYVIFLIHSPYVALIKWNVLQCFLYIVFFGMLPPKRVIHYMSIIDILTRIFKFLERYQVTLITFYHLQQAPSPLH